MTKDSGTGSKKRNDDLKAIGAIRKALEGFGNDDRERIIRWACEPFGVSIVSGAVKPGPALAATPTAPATSPTATPAASSKPSKDIAAFVKEKDPQSDIQLAATIAYYYRFEAPPNERRDEVDAEFLREACRRAGRPGQLKKPLATLNNAEAKGLLDRPARGQFVINSVGENLVGMTLPGGAVQPTRNRKARRPAKPAKARGRRK